MKNFLVHTDEVKKEMLGSIGVNTVEDLFNLIPEDARIEHVDFGSPLSELEVQRKIKELAKKNKSACTLPSR